MSQQRTDDGQRDGACVDEAHAAHASKTPIQSPGEELRPTPVGEGPQSQNNAIGYPGHVAIQPQAGTGRRVAIFAIIVGVGLIAMYGFVRVLRDQEQAALLQASRDAAQKPTVVNVVQPARAPAVTVLTLPGEARGFYDTTIYARVNGYLNRWLVDIGDHVKEHQLLATIETPELDQQLAEAQARVVALKADVQLAEAQANFAKVTSARWEAAAPEGAVSQQERDEKLAELRTAEAKLAAAKAQLDLGQATVKRLQFETSFKEVRAPFDGTITQRRIDVGSLISAGSTANTTPLFDLAQFKQVRVFVRVPQAAMADIHVGMPVGVRVRELPGRQFEGQVSRTSESVEPSSRTLNVEILVDNPDFSLVPGMYVMADFDMLRAHPPLLVQAGVVNLEPTGPQVAVIKDGVVHFRKVTIVRDLGDVLEISDGLRGSEWLALNISNQVSDGDRVTAVPIEEPSAQIAAGPQTRPATGSSDRSGPPEVHREKPASVAEVEPAPHGTAP